MVTTFAYLTTDESDLDTIASYTDATQTVRLPDGSFAFCDGMGGLFRRAVYQMPGHDYRYGEADASAAATNAHAALQSGGSIPPRGAVVCFEVPV